MVPPASGTFSGYPDCPSPPVVSKGSDYLTKAATGEDIQVNGSDQKEALLKLIAQEMVTSMLGQDNEGGDVEDDDIIQQLQKNLVQQEQKKKSRRKSKRRSGKKKN